MGSVRPLLALLPAVFCASCGSLSGRRQAPLECAPAPALQVAPPAAPAGAAPAPVRAAVPAAAPAPISASTPAAAPNPAAPRTFRETVTDLLREALAGRDRDLAPYADLLEEIDRLPPEAPERTTVVRDAERERAVVAAQGKGTALASIATFFERAGDAAALRRVFLDFDRSPELTGKPGTRLVSRTGPVSLGESDATRKVLWLSFSARWRFEARELDRGTARLFVSAMTPWEGTDHVLESRGVFVAVPERDGVRVAHAVVSAVDFAIPAIARGAAVSMAEREVRDRVDALRAHWREYVR